MKSKDVKYTEAITELEGIVEELEAENIDVDTLSEKVKRAAELIRICRSKLYKTENEIKVVIEELQKGEIESGPSEDKQ